MKGEVYMFEILGDILLGLIDAPVENSIDPMRSDFRYSLFDMTGGSNGTGKLIKSFESDFDPLITMCDLSTFIR